MAVKTTTVGYLKQNLPLAYAEGDVDWVYGCAEMTLHHSLVRSPLHPRSHLHWQNLNIGSAKKRPTQAADEDENEKASFSLVVTLQSFAIEHEIVFFVAKGEW